MSPDIQEIHDQLVREFPGSGWLLCKNPGPSAQHSILVPPEFLVTALRYIKDSLGYDFLSNLTGVDWPDPEAAARVIVIENAPAAAQGTEGGFLEVVYHLYSTTHRLGPLVLRARTADRGEGAVLPSATAIFRSAEFQEREIFDLFGIRFTEHPDLRRIFMWDEFVDYPMRKDYVPPPDYEYEPTPHDQILDLANRHLAAGTAGKEEP